MLRGAGDEHGRGLYLHFTHVSKQNSRSRRSPELVPCPAALPREEAPSRAVMPIGAYLCRGDRT